MQTRINFDGEYNTRILPSAQNSSTGYVGIGVVGIMVVGKTNPGSQKDLRFINCFQKTENGKTYIIKRPGFGVQSTPATGKKGTGLLVWTGSSSKIMSAFDDTNSTVYDGTTSKGAITGACTGLTETFVGSNVATLLATSTDNTAWYYDAGATVAVMTKITDVDFPGNAGKTLAGTFSHMDGYAVIMDTNGVLWASDVNSVTAWTSTSFGSANAYPDSGIGAVRYKNFIIAFGTESMEFWYNAGLTPFPFAKSVAMTQKIGCVSANAITQISDTVFWCGTTSQGGMSIFSYDGGISRISNPAIDATIILSGSTGIKLSSIRLYGLSFVLVTMSASTFAYCVEEKKWSEWNATYPYWYKCASVVIGSSLVNYSISNTSTDGKVYAINNSSFVYTDDSAAYTATIQLPREDFGTKKKKFFSELEIIGDKEDSASSISLSYTDDDYQNFTTYGNLDLSDDRPRATRLGSARSRAWKLEHSANTPFKLEALEVSVEVGQ